MRAPYKCSRCWEPGHNKNHCPNTKARPVVLLCGRCRKPGHDRRRCPERRTDHFRDVTKMVPEPAPVLPAPLADARYFQFPDGRRLAFRLPESGIDMADVRRIACHLLTLAKDWAPAEDATIAVIAEVLSLPGATP